MVGWCVGWLVGWLVGSLVGWQNITDKSEGARYCGTGMGPGHVGREGPVIVVVIVLVGGRTSCW